MVSKYTVFNYAPEIYEKDKSLVDSINNRVPYFGRGRPEDVPELARILKEYGYNGLRVASDKVKYMGYSPFMSLDRLVEVHPWRIVRVVNDMYFQANKRLHSFGNPIKNPQSPFYKKAPDLEKRIEDDGQMLLF